MLKLLNLYHDKLISKDKIAELLGYKYYSDFTNRMINLRNKVKKYPYLEEKILSIYPLFNKNKQEYCELLSDNEIKTLTMLNEKQNSISDEELAKILDFKTVQAYKTFRYHLFNKINNNNFLKLHILKFFPKIKLDTIYLTDKNKEMLILLEKYHDNPLSNEEMAKKIGYNKTCSYEVAKAKLFKKLRENEELYHEALEICPSLNLKRNAYKSKKKKTIMSKEDSKKETTLSNKNKEMLRLLEEYKDNPLSNSEMAKKLGYKNAHSYARSRDNMFKKLRENENLLEEVYTKYSFAFYEINNKNINFTVKDIAILKKYTLVKNNNLIYSSIKDIATYYSKSENAMYQHINKLKNKVISNLEDNIDLNTVLWPNFIEAFIARNNFSLKKSIKVKEEDLHSIRNNNTKQELLLGVKKLEESIFNEYVNNCDLKDKLILAFRLGYFNKRFFTSSEVANILDTDENYVIELTKDCLYNSRDAFVKEKEKLRNRKRVNG